jgi:hypothetical protein
MNTDDLIREFEKAQAVINDYGKVLEKALAMTYGAPESLLPYSREEIKRAIKLAVLILIKVEPSARDTIEQLRTCYVQLASFIADEEAAVGARAQAALDAGELPQMPAPDAQKALDRAQRIRTESQTLSLEFDHYLGDIGALAG